MIKPSTNITCLKSVRDQVGGWFAGFCLDCSEHSRRTASCICKTYRLYLLMDNSTKRRGVSHLQIHKVQYFWVLVLGQDLGKFDPLFIRCLLCARHQAKARVRPAWFLVSQGYKSERRQDEQADK